MSSCVLDILSALKREAFSLILSKDEVDIAETIDRLEEIAETLEDGAVDLTTAKELREETDDHLEKLRDALDVGDGDIIEIDGEDANVEASESAT